MRNVYGLVIAQFDGPMEGSNVLIMMTTSQGVTGSIDSVSPGDPNPTPVDQIPSDGCTYVWLEKPSVGMPFMVACTREANHEGRQHVAEGTEDTGVIAVHPWEA